VHDGGLPCEEIVDPGIGDPCLGAAMFSPGIIARDALLSSEKIDKAETRRCSFAAKVKDETVEAAAIWLQGLEYRIRNRLELVSTKARRNQDNPCVLRIRRNGFMSKLDEIDDVRGDDRPSFSRCVG